MDRRVQQSELRALIVEKSVHLRWHRRYLLASAGVFAFLGALGGLVGKGAGDRIVGLGFFVVAVAFGVRLWLITTLHLSERGVVAHTLTRRYSLLWNEIRGFRDL